MFLLFSLLLLQNAHAGEVIDLEEATRIALTEGVDLQRASMAVAERQVNLRTANLAWLPDLSARTSGQVSLGRTFSEQLGTNITEPVGSLSGGVNTSMPLFQGGALRARKEEARAWLAVAQADLQQVEQDIRWAVADGLLALGEARSAVAIQEAALDSAQALASRVALQVEVGTRTIADLHAQQAEVAAQEASLASARQVERETELALISLLRLDPRRDWTFIPPGSAPAVDGASERLLATALQERPALEASAWSVEAAEAALKVARAQRLPSLSLGAGVSTSYITSNPDPFNDQLLNQYRAWTAVDLTIPLFDRGIARARKDQAEIGLRRAELDHKNLTEQLAVDIERLLIAIDTAQASLVAAERREEAAEQALEVLTLRYEAGAADLVSVTDARTSLIAAEMQRARSASAVLRGNYLLAWTIGDLAGR